MDMAYNVLGTSCNKLVTSIDRLMKYALADYCPPSSLTEKKLMVYRIVPLLVLRPSTQFNHECHRELRKLEHVCKAELGGDVNTATTLL
jgi:hypothetical protein